MTDATFDSCHLREPGLDVSYTIYTYTNAHQLSIVVFIYLFVFLFRFSNGSMWIFTCQMVEVMILLYY